MVTAHTVVLLWFASASGWICASALSEIDLELQLADDWINLGDKKRRERKQQARQLLLSAALLCLSLVSLSMWLVAPAAISLALSLYARSHSTGKKGPRASQTLNVAGSTVEIAGPAIRAALSMLVAMSCLSVALGHIAGPWITAEVHEHLLASAQSGRALDNGDPTDIHGHVAARLEGEEFENKHLRHLMHVHDVIRAHTANGTAVSHGLGHHIKTLGHVVGASAEVAKLIGKGVTHHITTGIENGKKAQAARSAKRTGGVASAAGASTGTRGDAMGGEPATDGTPNGEGAPPAPDDGEPDSANAEGPDGDRDGDGNEPGVAAGEDEVAGATEPAAAVVAETDRQAAAVEAEPAPAAAAAPNASAEAERLREHAAPAPVVTLPAAAEPAAEAAKAAESKAEVVKAAEPTTDPVAAEPERALHSEPAAAVAEPTAAAHANANVAAPSGPDHVEPEAAAAAPLPTAPAGAIDAAEKDKVKEDTLNSDGLAVADTRE